MTSEPTDLTARRRMENLLALLDEPDQGKALRTVRTFAAFEQFCKENDFIALPTTSMVVRVWLHMNRHQWSMQTMHAYRTRINNVHEAAGYEKPCGRETSTYINSVCSGKEEQEKVRPIGLDEVVKMLGHRCDGEDQIAKAALDAYLLTGVLSGLRHADLSRLRIEDTKQTPDGFRLRVPRSKMRDEGFDVHLPHGNPEVPCTPECPCADPCPVVVLAKHLDNQRQRKRTSGYVFTSRRDRARAYQIRAANRDILERWTAAFGSDSGVVSTRSLRVGAATDSRSAGVSLEEVQQDLLKHRSPDTTLIYLRNQRTADPSVLDAYE